MSPKTFIPTISVSERQKFVETKFQDSFGSTSTLYGEWNKGFRIFRPFLKYKTNIT